MTAKDHAGGVPPAQIRKQIKQTLDRPIPDNDEQEDALVDDILALLLAEYKQLLNDLERPEMIPGWEWPCKLCGFDADRSRALIEARIKELEK